jgi:hypothetical protein
LKHLTKLAAAAMLDEERQGIGVQKLFYNCQVMPNYKVWHPQPKMALKGIECKPGGYGKNQFLEKY